MMSSLRDRLGFAVFNRGEPKRAQHFLSEEQGSCFLLRVKKPQNFEVESKSATTIGLCRNLRHAGCSLGGEEHVGEARF